MPTVWLPRGWEAATAPIATLLAPLGSHWLWFLLGVTLLGAALVYSKRSPAAAVVVATVGGLALAVAADGLVDDAYIQFRYAANLVAGNGPVFNPGEHIEGASGGLWIFLLAAVARLTGLDPGVVGRLLSLVMSAATVPAVALAVRPFAGQAASARAAVLWAAFPTAALYAGTGLETSAFAFGLWLAVAASQNASRCLAVTSGILVATLRPEGTLLAVAALPLWRLLPRGARQVVVSTLAAGTLAAAWRSIYYGLPFPNSALVKGVMAPAGPAEGLVYLGRAIGELFPVLALAMLASRRSPRSLLFALPAGAWTALVVLGGGDWMPGSRYLLPAAVVVTALAVSVEVRRPAIAVAVALGWSAFLLAPVEQPNSLRAGGLWRAMAEHRVQSRWWEALGTWLRSTAPPGTRLASGPVGALPFASRLPTFDLYGLCSPVVQHTSGEPGHRLWGIDQAVALGVDVLYPGRPLPQDGDAASLLRSAQAGVAGGPRILLEYRPLVVRHVAEFHNDVLFDVIWLRQGSSIRPTTSIGAGSGF